jgi:hypothetical protein
LAEIFSKTTNTRIWRSAVNKKGICALSLAMSLLLLAGCGGGGSGSSAGTGTVSLDIADAKPFIDATEQPAELWISFDAVLVHTSGGGWVSLDLPKTPFEINLLAFYAGRTTEFATPTRIPAGHITQIRFEIRRAYMVFADRTEEEIDLDVPSGTLRTDQQINWTLSNGGALSLTVHFDLSQSIVRSGPDTNPKYHLKPVVRLFNNEPVETATICGSVSKDSFADDAPVDVYVDLESMKSGVTETQPYTHVTVLKESEIDPTDFCIYWLVPLDTGESYNITIDNSGDESYYEVVPDLGSGQTVDLNKGGTITVPPPPPP